MVVMGNKKTKSFTNDDFYNDNELWFVLYYSFFFLFCFHSFLFSSSSKVKQKDVTL